MAFYDRGSAVQLALLDLVPGRTIHVDTANGSDAAGVGAGSVAFPYLTVGRAIQDLRDGQDDAIVVRGDITEQVIIADIDNFALIGLNSRVDGVFPQATTNVALSGTVYGIDETIRVTPAGTNPALNEGILLWDAAENGASRINTVGSVRARTASDFEMFPAAEGAGGDYPPSTLPTMLRVPMCLTRCRNVLVTGFTFDPVNSSVDNVSGLVVYDCQDVIIARNTWSRGMLGIGGKGFPGGAQPGNVGLVVQNNFFQTSLLEFFHPTIMSMPIITSHRQLAPVFVGNIISPSVLDIGFTPRGYAYTKTLGGEGYFNFTGGPELGILLSSNQFINKFGDPLGTPDYTSVAHLDAPLGSETGPAGTPSADPTTRVFFKGNYFQDQITGNPVDLDTTTLEDGEPHTVPNQSFLNTWRETVWNPQLSDLTDVDGSIGEALATSAYEGAVHINTIGGGTPGTLSGFNGLPTRPVDNLADARVLADDLGLTTYRITGTLTVDSDHEDWTFQGQRNPGSDAIVVVNPTSVARSSALEITVRGDITGDLTLQEAVLGAAATTTIVDSMLLDEVGVLGTIRLKAGAQVGAQRVTSRTAAAVIVDFDNQLSCSFQSAETQGLWIFRNASDISNVLAVTMSGALVTIEPSCAGHFQLLAGLGAPTDQGSAAVAFDSYVGAFGGDVDADASEVRDHIVAGGLIDVTTTPWRVTKFVKAGTAPDTTAKETYDLLDQDGNDIAGDHTGGNNPLFDPTRLLAQLRRRP